MSTQFQPLEIPPGVVAKPTKQMRSSNWAEVNLMRWVEGQMGPVGPQSEYDYSFASPCRAIHGWYGLDQVYRIAYLCEANIYVDVGGALTEISPAAGAGSAVAYSAGNYGAANYSGAGSSSGLIPPAPIGLGGYSDGAYSDDAYGTARSVNSITQLDQLPNAWSLDNFGAILYAMTSPDGRLLQWDPAVGGPAVITPGAPHGRLFVVTPERFIMIFGMTQDGTVGGGSARRFGWCDQENPTSWDFPDPTSQAGFLDIEPASPIITAISTRNGVLFWTGKTAYVSQFLGIPYVYNYVALANNCTPWSPESMVVTSAMTLWMSHQGAFSFDGTSIVPVACPVRPWVDDDIDLLNVREQACMVHVGDFNEVWWFFPQDTQPTNTRVIIYNYKEGWWSQGQMSRSAGITSSYTAHTIMADGLVAYQHEAGGAYPNGVPLPWAETFDLNLNSGSKLTTVKQMLPDVDGDVTNLLYSLFYRTSRSVSNGAPVIELQTAPKPVRPDGYIDFRTTGRDIRLRIALAGPAVLPVTVGQHLIDSVPRGDR
jgi:hypothetical protein